MARRRQTQQAFRGVAKFRDQNEKQFRLELLRIARRIDRQLREYVARYRTDEGAFRRNAENVARLRSARRQIDAILARSGYDAAVRELLRDTPEMLRVLDRTYTELGMPASLKKSDRRVIRLAVGAQLEEFANIGRRGADALHRGLISAVTGEQGERQWVRGFERALYGEGRRDRGGRGMFTHAGTLAVTSLDQIHRTANDALAKSAGVGWFQYFGGIISDTRPFCRNLDGRIFHRSEIARMSNGQSAGSVMVTGGGFNCRHEWLPVLTSDVPADIRARVPARAA